MCILAAIQPAIAIVGTFAVRPVLSIGGGVVKRQGASAQGVQAPAAVVEHLIVIRALGVGGTVAALRQNEMCSETSASRPLIQEPFLPLRSISPAEVIENKLAGLQPLEDG